jgi:methyl-accepting chemotaxis protein
MAAMGMTFLAIWLQEASLADSHHLVVIFIGLIAVAVAVASIVMMVIAAKALKAIQEMGATAEEIKGRILPMLDEVKEFSKTGREVLQDAAPKVKLITENLAKTSDALADTSNSVRLAVRQLDQTVTDANQRAQRQVARVDGMVTATLTAVVEVAETIATGIRVPVQKIAVMTTQAKLVGEGLLAKFKSMAARSPFGGQ